ncbi:MAG: DNA-directed polymerase [Firmicutes bacterium]|nr:DNA-directed polymerase [Bacillota bacterium]
MHVDMDAFFAAIEQRDHAEYRNKPVIVGGLSNRGVVSTASYEARKFGVFSAMSMAEARKRCPDGIFVSTNHHHYSEVSQDIFAIFADFAPSIEPLSLDEVFMDVSGMEKLVQDWREYALKLKKRIENEIGLVASVGIASNKFLAKLASDLEKPNGLVIIQKENAKDIIKDLPIRALWGVGKKTAGQLNALGFYTVGQIAMADRGFLVEHFGNLAYRLQELANGRDDREVETDRLTQSIGNEITFDQDLLSGVQAEKELLALAEKVGWRLRIEGVAARTITIKIRFASFATITRSQTLLEAINFDEDIYKIAVDLYKKCVITEKIRLLGITGNHLSINEQFNLFEEDAKKKTLYGTLDKLKKRYGEKIITKAKLLNPKE